MFYLFWKVAPMVRIRRWQNHAQPRLSRGSRCNAYMIIEGVFGYSGVQTRVALNHFSPKVASTGSKANPYKADVQASLSSEWSAASRGARTYFTSPLAATRTSKVMAMGSDAKNTAVFSVR